MARKKKAVSKDEKFEKQDFNLFEALAALDNKDYDYYNRLTLDQQKKFVPFMLMHWMSAIKSNGDLSRYYVMSTNEHANTHLFNENVIKHPKLQWYMLCASSPGLGKQFHQWIPHIKERVSKLKEPAKEKDIKEYYKKIYKTANDSDLSELSKVFVDVHKRKMYLANKFPNMKFEDIELLGDIITDEDIDKYEKELGN